MTAKHPSYRSWARLLLLLLTITWTFRTLHGFWLHGADGDRVSCDAEHRGAPPHLHQGHDGERDCPFCAFVFAISEPALIAVYPDPLCRMPRAAADVFYQPLHARPACGTIQLRGPPAGTGNVI